MSAPARRIFCAPSRQAWRSPPPARSRTSCSVAPPGSLVSGPGPGAAACAAPPEPEACGLEAASGALPVATGAVGGAAGCEEGLLELPPLVEPPPCVPGFAACCWPPLCGAAPVAGAAPPEFACGLEAASGALPVATGVVGGAAGCEEVLVELEGATEPPPWVPEFAACCWPPP